MSAGRKHGAHCRLHQVLRQFIEFGARQRGFHVLGAGAVRREERQADGGGGQAGKFDFRLFRRLAHAVHGRGVARQIDLCLFFEFAHQIVRHALVKIVAAQAVVAGGGQHLDHVGIDVQDGNVERAAAQVEDHDLLRGLFIDAVGQRGGGRLIDDAPHVQPGDFARVLGGLALRVGKIGGHGDDRVCHRRAEVGFGVCFELLQDHGGNLLRREGLAIDLYPIVAAHFPLDGIDRALRIHRGLPLGRLAYDALAIFGEGHNGRRGASAVGTGNDNGFAVFHHGHTGIRCAQINANATAHTQNTPLRIVFS